MPSRAEQQSCQHVSQKDTGNSQAGSVLHRVAGFWLQKALFRCVAFLGLVLGEATPSPHILRCEPKWSSQRISGL